MVENFGNASEQITAKSVHDVLLSLIKSNAVLLINVASLHAERIFNYDYVRNNINEQFMPYIAALAVLGFLGADIGKSAIERIVNSMGIPTNNEILENLSELEKHENYLIYANAIHFIMSTGMEPTMDRILEVSKALGIEPNSDHASAVLLLYRNPPHSSLTFIDPSLRFRNGGKGYLLRMRAHELLRGTVSAMYQMVIRDFYMIYHDDRILKLGNDAIPYVAAAVTLSYTARNITKDGIAVLLQSVGISTRDDIQGAMTSVYHYNNVAYVLAVFAIALSGKEPNVEQINKTALTLGVVSDLQLAEFALLLYKSYKTGTNMLGV